MVSQFCNTHIFKSTKNCNQASTVIKRQLAAANSLWQGTCQLTLLVESSLIESHVCLAESWWCVRYLYCVAARCMVTATLPAILMARPSNASVVGTIQKPSSIFSHLAGNCHSSNYFRPYFRIPCATQPRCPVNWD